MFENVKTTQRRLSALLDTEKQDFCILVKIFLFHLLFANVLFQPKTQARRDFFFFFFKLMAIPSG